MRRRLLVQGIVQGVSFRPWVHQLARTYGLFGHVFNSTAGITIEIEGSETLQQRFLESFNSHPPPLAIIDDVRVETLETAGYTDFEIRESVAASGEFVLVPPDISTLFG